MYITGGGSGAGLLLLVVIGILIWRCKYPKVKKSSFLLHVIYSFTDPENSNMVYSKLDAIRAKKGLAFGQETVETKDPVLAKLREANLKLKKSKCSFFKKEIHYLGHLLTTDGVKPQPDITGQTVTCPIHPCGPIKGTNYQSQANQS